MAAIKWWRNKDKSDGSDGSDNIYNIVGRIQGYLIAKPMAESEIIKLLATKFY